MKITKDLIITNENKDYYSEITECDRLIIKRGVEFTANVLTTCGNVDLRENAKFTANVLTTCGYVHLMENVKFTANVLTTCSSVYLYENAKFTANVLINLNYKSVDNTLFVINSEKSIQGIKIYKGYNLTGLENSNIKKEECFVAEKDSFFAHGITVKKAIKDLQFKIVAKKLKKDPILPDTKITVEYYRIITGACEHGTKSFQEQYNLKDEYSAKELLPILEKHGAYGIQNFKKLINW